MMFSTARVALVSAFLSSFVGFAVADFHFVTETCSEAGGGYFDAGFILSPDQANCLDAKKHDEPGNNIPSNSLHPNAIVCGRNVTIDLEALVWFTSDTKKKQLNGECKWLGKNDQGKNSTCTPFESQCSFSDRVKCTSSICKKSRSFAGEYLD